MATAVTQTTVLAIEKNEMMRLLHAEHELSDRFISYTLTRNIRIEARLHSSGWDLAWWLELRMASARGNYEMSIQNSVVAV